MRKGHEKLNSFSQEKTEWLSQEQDFLFSRMVT